MVDRFHFMRLAAEHATPTGRTELVDRARAALAGLPGVVSVSAGIPADDSAASWDACVTVRCIDLDAWQACAGSAPYQDLLDWIGSRAVVVKSWAFDIRPATVLAD